MVPVIISQEAQKLLKRFAAAQRFSALPRACPSDAAAGMSDLPSWRVWTQRPTTGGQLRIEAKLEELVTGHPSVLHIGIGNSSLARRFAPRLARLVGTTISEEEAALANGLGLGNYKVRLANKLTCDMDGIPGPFDFIVDNNPTGFACCLPHFAQMMATYLRLLKPMGGLLLTERQGLGWVCHGNHPGWSFSRGDWETLASICSTTTAFPSDEVFAMRHLNTQAGQGA